MNEYMQEGHTLVRIINAVDINGRKFVPMYAEYKVMIIGIKTPLVWIGQGETLLHCMHSEDLEIVGSI